MRLGHGAAAAASRRRAAVPAAGVEFLAPLAFIIANLIVLFAGWTTYCKLLLAIALGFILFGISAATRPKEERPALDFAAGDTG